jgi:prepilin-type N-terminal cleavage/methylation domain-containing protein
LHRQLTFGALRRASGRGFTLIEIMVVLTIISIMLVIGVPAMGEFVADQRVRTVASDINSEISLARAKAIETSRRVYMQKLGVNWNNGWRLYADVNDNAAYDAGIDLELKRFDGFITGTLYVCTLPVGAFTNQIVFRPDGRVVRTGAVTANDGIYVVDTMTATTPITNYKIRGLQFGLSGRATMLKLNGQAVPCAAN